MAKAVRNHVERLAGSIGERNIFRPEALADARTYIVEEWERQGYQVTNHWYDARGLRCANLEVTRVGSRHPEQILLVGAHYDSVIGSPGANDNASGVAAVLELSRHPAPVAAFRQRFAPWVERARQSRLRVTAPTSGPRPGASLLSRYRSEMGARHRRLIWVNVGARRCPTLKFCGSDRG